MDKANLEKVHKLYKDFMDKSQRKVNFEEGCRNPTLAKCGGEAQHSQSWGFGVLWDS